MLKLKNLIVLQEAVETKNLELKLIEQLNKDFHLSGISKFFDVTSSFENLKDELSVTLLNLIQFKYDDYLNLIYRIDLSEKELAIITNSNLTDVVNQLVFLILKREFQKIWFKQYYK
ncbi:hypothetical protein MKD41_13795 [Lutibacter sp. A64]|uniref:hypothetical protein n=1 Tax=Lutibacter sp. A64 TaxID=2918526 RepID=UPI001F052C07|nr:hypothetical protein [Lutibacter sp. A64]UMB53395.1 hypothetical protein MKD41_13795 [Lutibacter sp. A64]